MSDATTDVYSIANELGFNLDSTDASSSEETVTESKDAASEVENEGVKPESEVEGKQDADSVVTEEDANVPPPEAAEPEQKLTLKEFRELEAKRIDLEAKEKSFTERMALKEREFQEKYHEKVKVHDQMDDFLAHLAEKDAELFDIIKAEFADHQKQYSNPVIDSLKNQIESITKELGQFKNNTSDVVTRTKLDSEMNKVKSTIGKDAEAAGVKIDWKQVEDAWADNPKLSVEQAVFALYGQNMMKASASKAKVAEVTKKVEARPAVNTAGSVKHSSTPVNAAIPSDAFGAVHHFAKQLTGKSY